MIAGQEQNQGKDTCTINRAWVQKIQVKYTFELSQEPQKKEKKWIQSSGRDVWQPHQQFRSNVVVGWETSYGKIKGCMSTKSGHRTDVIVSLQQQRARPLQTCPQHWQQHGDILQAKTAVVNNTQTRPRGCQKINIEEHIQKLFKLHCLRQKEVSSGKNQKIRIN